MDSGKKWINRTTDNRSLTLNVTLAASFAALYAGVAIIFYGLEIDGSFISKYGYFGLIVIDSIIFIGAFLFMRNLGQIIFFIKPRYVAQGHLGLMKFRGAYTGEIAESGPVMFPQGYDFDEVDCRQFTLESDLSEVRSRDGFVVKANLTAWLKVSNPMPYVTEGFSNDEMKKLLRSALFSAASRKNALDIIGDRDQICAEAVKEVAELTSHYGVEVVKVAVDIQSIPEELTSFIQMLAILEKKYPQGNASELIEIIMMNSGKVTKNRSEITNITKLEVPGLDAVMAAAARRFG